MWVPVVDLFVMAEKAAPPLVVALAAVRSESVIFAAVLLHVYILIAYQVCLVTDSLANKQTAL